MTERTWARCRHCRRPIWRRDDGRWCHYLSGSECPRKNSARVGTAEP